MKRSLLFITCFVAMQAFAQQDKTKMERERQDIQKELQEMQSAYNNIKKNQKATIGQVAILDNKMRLQGKYINNINQEIRLLSDDIYLSNVEITRLQRQLDTLKSEYARSVVYSYKNSNSYDYLNFIFSASNFNDALRRVAYLKSYRAYNEKKVATILDTKTLIEQRKQQLLGKTKQKSSALENQKDQLNELEGQKKEKDKVVTQLKSQANDLTKQITTKKKRDQLLRNQIAAIIKREIAEARRREKEEADRLAALRKAEDNKTTATTPKTNTGTVTTPKSAPRGEAIKLTDKEVVLSSSFNSNRGRLPWPVDGGFVSIPFGEYQIPGTSLRDVNPGLTLSTPSAGATVKAVFDGEVSAVSNLGDAVMVMIKHGSYYTVYSNLSSASVSRGSTVKTGQAIGRSGTADDGSGGQLDFLLMVGEKNVNPRPWLR